MSEDTDFEHELLLNLQTLYEHLNDIQKCIGLYKHSVLYSEHGKNCSYALKAKDVYKKLYLKETEKLLSQCIENLNKLHN